MSTRSPQKERIYPVYGVPTRVICDSPHIAELADDAFGAWNTLRADDIAPSRPAKCQISLQDLDAFHDIEETWTTTSDRVIAKHPECIMVADRVAREATIEVAPNFLRHSAQKLQKNFLECAVQFIASAEDRVPLHAAAAIIHGRPVLLVGPSNAGKSTLLYALARRGCTVLAEDHLCIAHEGGLALWGKAEEVGLRPDALALFSELSSATAHLQPNGKWKYLARLRDNQRAYPKHRGPALLVFLNPENGVETIQAISRDIAQTRLLTDREPGFDLAPDYAVAIKTLLDNATSCEIFRNERPIPTAEMLCAWVKASSPARRGPAPGAA